MTIVDSEKSLEKSQTSIPDENSKQSKKRRRLHNLIKNIIGKLTNIITLKRKLNTFL